MDSQVASGASEAKRSRFNSGGRKHEVDFEDDYELELHQSGTVDEFELLNANENEWTEDDEEHVKVEIRNLKEGLKRKATLHPTTGQRKFKHPSSVSDSDGGDNDEARNGLKRPFDGQTANYERETDPVVIARRAKQIDYGKNTPEYFNYVHAVPK